MKAVIALPTEQDTIALAQKLKPLITKGDHIFLSGDLGAGKSLFARAVIQSKMADSGMIEDVPSPSFTLVQTYEFEDFDIWHVDLYRLEYADLEELGLPEAMDDAVLIIEWPDRLGDQVIPALSIDLGFADAGGRIANVEWTLKKFTKLIAEYSP
ncbi:MAG: tRNA (adenosine(37)-N6)-threonylcarbamoyltransferase complex ATPase subunit type 1 TsaE [Pseudomonadota bacterium]